MSRPRIGSLAVALVLGACDQAATPTQPRPVPVTPLAAKQGTTNGRMLYEAVVDRPQVFVMNQDGTNAIRLTNGPAAALAPSWAPDGKRILFASDRADPGIYLSIYAMNADGTGITRLTTPPSGAYDDSPVALGKGILFRRNGSIAGESGIYRANADGTGLTQLTNGPWDIYPAASPSGKEIAFSRDGDIYVLDLGTGRLTNITQTPGVTEVSPAYSPGGKQIAMARYVFPGVPGETRYQIAIVNRDGSQLIEVSPFAAGPAFGPKWSPDGKRIAFTSSGGIAVGRVDIYVMNADGTGVTNLTRTDLKDEVLGAWTAY